MSEVWLVEYAYPYDGGYFVGAYANQQLAEEAKAKVEAEHTNGVDDCSVDVKVWREPIRADSSIVEALT
jgi:hypothetical protein